MKHTFADELSRTADNSIDSKTFAGGFPEAMARFPEIRMGKWWITTRQSLLLLVPVGIAGTILSILTARFLRTFPAVQQFIATYPGTGSFAPPLPDGFPLWLRTCHWINFLDRKSVV